MQAKRKYGDQYYQITKLATKNRFDSLKFSQIQSKEESDVKIAKNDVEKLSTFLTFAPEVVAERCAPLLTYNEKIYEDLYNSEMKGYPQRSNYQKMSKKVPTHHCAMLQEPKSEIKLPPVYGLTRTQKEFQNKGKLSLDKVEVKLVNDDNLGDNPWDEYILSNLSENTAKFVAYQLSNEEPNASRLKSIVSKWYSPPTSQFIEIIPYNDQPTRLSTPEVDMRSVYPYKYYMDQVRNKDKPPQTKQPLDIELTARKKVRQLYSDRISCFSDSEDTDAYNYGDKAAFYRLPMAIRRQKKQENHSKLEILNKTALEFNDYVPPKSPPDRLDTVLSSKMGNKVLSIDNKFTNQIYMDGTNQQEKMLHESDNLIKLHNTIYRKKLQPTWPPSIPAQSIPDPGLMNDHCNDEASQSMGRNRVHRRWTNYPDLEKVDAIDPAVTKHNNEEQERMMESRKKTREHSSLNVIVDEWRKNWHLSQKMADADIDELLRDLSDVHPTIRLQAIVTIARYSQIGIDDQNKLPEVIWDSLGLLLDDHHPQVSRAAAISLLTLSESAPVKYRDKATAKLRKDLLPVDKQSSRKADVATSIDRWTAAQCLAREAAKSIANSPPDCVLIGELIWHLIESDNDSIIVHKQARQLLAQLSRCQTPLVSAMLAEKLSSVSWRQRVIICETLPLLSLAAVQQTRDLISKLVHLMWNDPHHAVQLAASRALGRTGNGHAVHEMLLNKLSDRNSETARNDALLKIAALKILTSRLMPEFLRCFHDEFVNVRKSCCRACCHLKISDELCVTKLLELAQYDPEWTVKAYALRALGIVRCEGGVNPRLVLIWAAQFEHDVRVRREALIALLRSQKMDNEIVQMLQSRFLVEEDPAIVRVLRKSLAKIGIDPDRDIDTVAEIKREVRRVLSDNTHIASLILLNETREDYLQLHKDYIAPPEITEPDEFSETEETEEETNEEELRDIQRLKEKTNSDLMRDINEVLLDNLFSVEIRSKSGSRSMKSRGNSSVSDGKSEIDSVRVHQDEEFNIESKVEEEEGKYDCMSTGSKATLRVSIKDSCEEEVMEEQIEDLKKDEKIEDKDEKAIKNQEDEVEREKIVVEDGTLKLYESNLEEEKSADKLTQKEDDIEDQEEIKSGGDLEMKQQQEKEKIMECKEEFLELQSSRIDSMLKEKETASGGDLEMEQQQEKEKIVEYKEVSYSEEEFVKARSSKIYSRLSLPRDSSHLSDHLIKKTSKFLRHSSNSGDNTSISDLPRDLREIEAAVNPQLIDQINICIADDFLDCSENQL